jgi:tRNA(Ile)-lysidine synthase
VRYARNRVRHELLPLLAERYNPRVREALLRFAEAQRADAKLLDDIVDAAFERCMSDEGTVGREAFRNEADAIRRRVVARLGRRLGVGDLPFDRVLGAAQFIANGATGAVFDLGSGAQLQNGRRHTKALQPPEAVEAAETPLAVPGTMAAFGRVFRARMLEERPAAAASLRAYCTPRRQVFDADAVGGDLSLRRRRPGDSFTPLGMTGRKKLQDYFVDAGVPAYERDTQVLLTGGGKILWVVGGAIGSHAAVTESTTRFLEVDIIDGTEETAALDGGTDSGEG